MTLSPNEAADALRDVADVERRSSDAYGYLLASPALILWGVLWAVGYGLSDVWPRRGAAIWIVIDTIGLLAGFFIALSIAVRLDAQAGAPSDPTRRRAVSRLRWTFTGIASIASAFVAATLVVMSPVSPRQIGAFIPLVVAAGYALLGLWCGVRFIAVSAALALLTLGGFFLLPAHFALWMAAVGGGALVLGGVWLRRA